MNQQNQTLDYFNAHALDWNSKANDKEYSVIENRHNAVLETLKKFPEKATLLDVGCGTGQLAIEASKRGWVALGVDFAPEMIEICNQNKKIENSDAVFSCSSIFGSDLTPASFDVISAQGFIEYISLQQLDEFLDISKKLFRSKGRLVLGSRNRLFNLHSLNEFTELESALGTIDKIIQESVILQKSDTQEEAISSLGKLAYEYEQPSVHPLTGIKVDTRYQFTPSDLITRLSKHNFRAERIYPVHVHPFPISLLKNKVALTIYRQIANLASKEFISEHKLVPYSSSFVIDAVSI
jgi:2-polyprenyl-3-methyl-5-hydroxy-6-metoxy-1,4-benzoquinol methylase